MYGFDGVELWNDLRDYTKFADFCCTVRQWLYETGLASRRAAIAPLLTAGTKFEDRFKMFRGNICFS